MLGANTNGESSGGRLFQAEKLIIDAIESGACADPRLLEATAMSLDDLTDDLQRQLKLMLDVVRFFYVNGQSDRGLNVAEKARNLALATADKISASIALTLIGVCAADTGNLPRAMEAYADGLSLAQKNGDTIQESKIWHNLGAALIYSGLFNEALGCFTRALEIAGGKPELDTTTYSNIALCCLNLDEIPRGIAAIRKSIDLAADPTDANSILNRVVLENIFTRLLIEIDDFGGAMGHAAIARKYAAMSKSPRSDITASVAEGLAEVFSGHSDIGLSRLTRTLARAKALKIAIREVLVAIIKAHEYIGQHDKALVYLKEMLASQFQTQEANALRHVERHLQQLHINEGNAPIENSKQIIKRLNTHKELIEGRIAKRDLFRQSVESLERLAVATELRDDSTGEHSYRVGRMAALLAKEAGCDEDMVFMIDIAARMHDIGKIAIPDGILLKPGALNASERQIMEMHAEAGADVLAKSNIPQIQMAEEIARYHHERWDGLGYPKGLAGEAIPLSARISALADVFDALTHARPYKVAWTIESSLTEILALRGINFDPRLTDLFLGLVSRLVREGVDLDELLGEEARKSSFNRAKGQIWDNLRLAKEQYQNKNSRTTDLQR